MKLMFLLTVVCFLQTSATVYSQATKFSFELSNQRIKDILQDIENNSEYRFFYQREQVDVEQMVTLKINNETIEDILPELFKGQEVVFDVRQDNLILIKAVQGAIGSSTEFYAQQQKSVTGKVTDASGNPLPGVTVIIKGTTNGTVTNFDGNYTLPNIPEDAILSFSFVGMKTQEIPTAGKTAINITLVEDAIGIEEVVAVGYGTMKKSDVTGSVSTVKVNETQAAQINAVDKLIQGRAAGVDVVSGNGAPGAALNVKIRGVGTLSGNSEPLYVVDGVLINTSNQEVKEGITSGNYSQESQSGLTAINPQDIESIEILKDASATAVYGSRGANGVVLITTKKGKAGKTKISFTANTDISKVSKKLPIFNDSEYALFHNELSNVLGLTPIYPSTQEGLDSLLTIDWQDYTLRTAISQNYRLTMSGKNEKTNYYIAAGYGDYEGIIKNTSVRKGDLRVNLEQEMTDKLKISSNTAINFQKNNWTQGTVNVGQGNASMVRSMLRKSPILGFETDDSSVDEFSNSQSPKTFFEQFQDLSKEFRLISSLNFDYKISKVFSYRLALGGDYRNKNRQQFQGPGLYFGGLTNGIASWSALEYYAYSIDNLLNFNKQFGEKHRLNGTVGCTYDSNFTQSASTSSTNFFTTVLKADGITLGQTYYPFNLYKSQISIASTLARATYNYNEKYLVTLTGRIDGSSKFAPGQKYGFFPAVALAWRADQEEFIQDLNIFTTMKVRMGWGQTGVQSISAYQTQALYGLIQTPNASDGLDVGQVASRIANNNLTWETSEQLNAGVDLGFWENRLKANIDVYKKSSIDLLQNFQIPPSTGFSTIAMNLGSIENKGIEINLDGIILDKKFKWNIGGNISINRNKLKSLGLPVNQWGTMQMAAYTGAAISTGNQLKVPANIFAEGHPVGMFWGLKTDGIYQSTDTLSLTYRGIKMVPGDVKFIDQDGNGIIDAGDNTFIGNPNPDFTYGISTSLSYKNLKLDIQINGVYGRDICNANLVFEEYTGDSNGGTAGQLNIRKDAWYNAWRPDAPTNAYPRLGYVTPIDLSDRFIEEGSFVRLGNITLSYDIPVKRMKIFSNLGVFLAGNNLLLLTKYKGYDPEVNSFTYEGGRIGIDYNSYPSSKSVSFGITAGF